MSNISYLNLEQSLAKQEILAMLTHFLLFSETPTLPLWAGDLPLWGEFSRL